MSVELPKGIKSPEEFFSIRKPCTDLDGPIFDTHTHAIKRCNEELGTNYDPLDIREWHAIRNFALAAGWSFEKACDLEERVYYHPDELRQVELTPGAEKFTRWFYDRRIPLEIASSRRPGLRQVTLEVLIDKLPWIREESLIMQKTNEMDGDIFKALIVNIKRFGIYFEDELSHAKTILDYTDAHVVLLSNLSLLDHYDNKRLIRFGGSFGQAPNLLGVNKYFNL